MFVYINVIENLTAYFGVCDADFFLKNLEHFIVSFSALHNVFVFAFCAFAVYQVHGKLPYQQVNGVTNFPFMLAFSLITLYALS
jgi:succinate dehydrogenase hydrophobic anchor subunit